MPPARVLGVLAATAGLYIAQSSAAHADPVSDFKFGTTVFLRSATIDLEGNKTSTGGIPLSKPANTLTFDVAASDIGASLPITLHLVGQALGGNSIQYAVNWSGNVDIDGHGHMLTAASGTFLATASAVTGTAIGNVAIEVIPVVSYLNVTGDWGTKTIFINKASFFGGYLPATLSGFHLSDGAPLCSDTTAKKVKLAVNLNNPAPPSGQWVFLTSAYHLGLYVPPIVIVPPGKKSLVFDATVAANFVGIVHTTATAGVGIGSLDIEVDTKHDCDPGSGGSGPPVAYNPDPGCIMCTIYATMNDWGERLGYVGRDTVLIRGTTVQSLVTQFAAYNPTTMSARSLSNSGFLTGLVTIAGHQQAYRANVDLEPGKLDLFGAMVPMTVGVTGTVVGYRIDATTGRQKAAFNIGTGVIDLPLPSSFDAFNSVALSINDAGEILGTYTQSATGPTHGFRYSFSRGATALPAAGASPVAFNASGQVAANSVNAAGAPVSAIISASNTVTLLGSPSGYGAFTVKSMNKFGWAVGTASALTTGASITRAFVWSPTTGFRALSAYNRALPVVDDAVALTDANTVVVHGTNAAGVANLYVLPL